MHYVTENWENIFLPHAVRRIRWLYFAAYVRSFGYELYEMDLISAGEDFYAEMRRSTNGGGENSPKLEGEDDFYELLMASLQEAEKAAEK